MPSGEGPGRRGALSLRHASAGAGRWLVPWVRWVVVAVVGFAFGYAANQLPAPETVARMWPGSLGAPYVVLPFVAGAWVFPGRAGAVLAGLTVVFAGFFGYYADLLDDRGVPWTVLLTPRNPWLPLEIAAGVVFGYLGHRWWRRGSARAVLACAAVPVVEAGILLLGVHSWVLRRVLVLDLNPPFYSRSPWNVGLWVAEVLVAVLLAWLAIRHGVRRRRDR